MKEGPAVMLQYFLCKTINSSNFLMDIAELLKRLQNLDTFSFTECQYIILTIAFI